MYIVLYFNDVHVVIIAKITNTNQLLLIHVVLIDVLGIKSCTCTRTNLKIICVHVHVQITCTHVYYKSRPTCDM